MATLRQLSFKERIQKRRRCKVAALIGSPMRKGVIMKMAITTPRKPNSAKRKYAKVRVIRANKVVHCHIPGLGPTYIQEYSIVMIEGGCPPDVPGVNYSLIRGLYDFEQPESFGRHQRRSKFGAKRPLYGSKRKIIIYKNIAGIAHAKEEAKAAAKIAAANVGDVNVMNAAKAAAANVINVINAAKASVEAAKAAALAAANADSGKHKQNISNIKKNVK
jgi:small subunit ribosomal protein S12